MREVTGDLWEYPAQYRVITTNGTVRKDGACVMGRGCAHEAQLKYPHLPWDLGKLIHAYGNKVWVFPNYSLITFPVKHNWWETADLALIRESVQALKVIAEGGPLNEEGNPPVYVMPRPGCGNGRLRWEDVRPLLLALPDNVHVITWEEGK